MSQSRALARLHHVKAVLDTQTAKSSVELNGQPFSCFDVEISHRVGGTPKVTLSFYARVEVEATTDDLKRVSSSARLDPFDEENIEYAISNIHQLIDKHERGEVSDDVFMLSIQGKLKEVQERINVTPPDTFEADDMKPLQLAMVRAMDKVGKVAQKTAREFAL